MHRTLELKSGGTIKNDGGDFARERSSDCAKIDGRTVLTADETLETGEPRSVALPVQMVRTKLLSYSDNSFDSSCEFSPSELSDFSSNESPDGLLNSSTITSTA